MKFSISKTSANLLTDDRIAQWFKWKNGSPLSQAKTQSILRYSSPEERISHDTSADELRAFLSRPGGVIWRVFWLHLQHPELYPIYDQHVHRAMAFMLNWPEIEIPASDAKRIRNYLEYYRPFFSRFQECDSRLVDRALWSFGLFLKDKAYSCLVGSLLNASMNERS